MMNLVCGRRGLVAFGWLVALSIVAGCSRSPYDASVSGTVTLNGEAIGPGVVIFAPAGVESNPARGAIQPDGTYVLKTSRDEGLSSGKYQVALQIVERTNVPPGERDMRPTKSRIPEKYTSTTTSGFEFEVAPGHNTIDLQLQSDSGAI